jgi:hypothetical protein
VRFLRWTGPRPHSNAFFFCSRQAEHPYIYAPPTCATQRPDRSNRLKALLTKVPKASQAHTHPTLQVVERVPFLASRASRRCPTDQTDLVERRLWFVCIIEHCTRSTPPPFPPYSEPSGSGDDRIVVTLETECACLSLNHTHTHAHTHTHTSDRLAGRRSSRPGGGRSCWTDGGVSRLRTYSGKWELDSSSA